MRECVQGVGCVLCGVLTDNLRKTRRFRRSYGGLWMRECVQGVGCVLCGVLTDNLRKTRRFRRSYVEIG